jgi:hypothetical protein
MKKCDVVINGKVFLRGYKDPSMDLWLLLLYMAKMWSALI